MLRVEQFRVRVHRYIVLVELGIVGYMSVVPDVVTIQDNRKVRHSKSIWDSVPHNEECVDCGA